MAKYKPLLMSESAYTQAAENYIGFCKECHSELENCEPDAREYICPDCEHPTVYGAQECLFMGIIEFTEDGKDD